MWVYVCLVFLLVAGTLESVAGAGPLNNFSVVGYSAQWAQYNGYATNLLPQNNPKLSREPYWNAASGYQYITPYWVTFDLGAIYPITTFQYMAFGDVTHDPKNFQIQISDKPTGTYTTVANFTGASGYALQAFPLGSIKARYWKFNILSTYSQYQAYVSYVNFIVGCSPWNGSPLLEGESIQIFSQRWATVGYPWLNYGQTYVGVYGLMLSQFPATFTLNGIETSSWPDSSGQQGLLVDDKRFIYQADYQGNYVVRGVGKWNFAVLPNSAPNVYLAVNQNYPPGDYNGRTLGVNTVTVNNVGQYILDYNFNDSFTLFTC